MFRMRTGIEPVFEHSVAITNKWVRESCLCSGDAGRWGDALFTVDGMPTNYE
jgi:hypothetical protein